MQRLITLLCVILIASIAYGQKNISVSGRITDKSNTPLQGANIYIPELQIGTVSGKDGEYHLEKLKKGRFKIEFSYIGYETEIKDIVLTDKDIFLDLELQPSAFLSQVVVLSGGRPSSQHENAIKIETISLENITSAGSPSLMKSLATIPGVDVITKGSGVTTPVIRGLTTSNILVLNNGIRLENYQFSTEHPYLVDEFGVDQVEIIKGPASLLYGSDAIGGVMNFIKEKPAVSGSIQGDATLQYHSNTNGFVSNVGIKGSKGKLQWGLRGGLKSHMDYIQGNGDFVPNTRFNQEGIKSFLGLNTRNGVFRIYYDYVGMRSGMSVKPAIALIDERGRKNEIWYQDLDLHMISSRNTLYLNGLKLQANLAYQYNQRKLKGDEPEPDFIKVDARLNTLNYEVKTSYSTSERSHFILSVQGMYQQNRNQEAPEHVLPDYDLNDIALSGLVQHDFSKLHLQVGLRFDNRIIDVPEQEMHGHSHEEEEEDEEPEEEVLEELNQYYGNISGSLGVTYEWTENLLVRANLASAYRTPSVAELTQDGIHGVRYEQGNRALRSQRNFEADLGLHFHSEKWMFDLAAFYNYIVDYIFLSPTSDTASDGQIIYRYRQNDAQIYGIEAVTEYSLKSWLSLKGSYGFLRGKQTDGTNVPFIPQNKLNIDVKWMEDNVWKFNHLFVRIGSLFAFDQVHPANFETSTSAYTLFDAGLGFTVFTGNIRMEFELTASNLLNRRYIDHLSTLKDLGYEDPGRNIMVHLKIPFIVKD